VPNIKQQLETVLSKEMDRRNFLQYGGTIILALFGITGLLRALMSGIEKTQTNSTDKTSSNGYGSSRYGQ
jgi:hypothetical protein